MKTYNNSTISPCSIFVGMDVHKKTIALCVYSVSAGIVLDERELLHDVPRVTKYLQKVQGREGELRCCYEASSCGFGLQRALHAQGILCEVIAPSSIPIRSVSRMQSTGI